MFKKLSCLAYMLKPLWFWHLWEQNISQQLGVSRKNKIIESKLELGLESFDKNHLGMFQLDVYWLGIILRGSCPGGLFPGGSILGANCPGGNFPGGSFPRTYSFYFHLVSTRCVIELLQNFSLKGGLWHNFSTFESFLKMMEKAFFQLKIFVRSQDI